MDFLSFLKDKTAFNESSPSLQLEEESAGDLVKYCKLFCMSAFRLQVVRFQSTVEDIPALA